jgi:universal stress protein A
MEQLSSIAVGIDFSPSSESALRQAIRLAALNQAELHLVHVIDQDVLEDLQVVMDRDARLPVDDLVQRATESLRIMLEVRAGPSSRLHVRIARPAVGIIGFSNELRPELLILGMQGHRSDQHRAGSQAMRVVKAAPVQTLLVHDAPSAGFRRVTVCTDFSSSSDLALSEALRIAVPDRSQVELLHVFTPPWRVLPEYVSIDRLPMIGAKRDYRSDLSARLEAAIAANAAGYPVEPRLVEHSNHADGILEHAHTGGSDLVVIGHRGRSGFIERLLLGSTAERVIREAVCSVLVARAD